MRYEAQSFETVARPKIPLCIVGRNDSVDATDCPRTTDDLSVVSSFETLVAGIRIVPTAKSHSIFATRKGRLPPFYVGLGLMSYGKPYQINVDGVALEEFLFDGRFRGAGLALGTEFGGGARRFFANVDVQVGLGEVQLTNYKVRIVNPLASTAARVLVLIESRDSQDRWATVGVSENIIEASWIALVDSVEYKLFKDGTQPPGN